MHFTKSNLINEDNMEDQIFIIDQSFRKTEYQSSFSIFPEGRQNTVK